MLGLRIGSARVLASAAGWRRASETLTVFEGRDSTVLQEVWNDAVAARLPGHLDGLWRTLAPRASSQNCANVRSLRT